MLAGIRCLELATDLGPLDNLPQFNYPEASPLLTDSDIINVTHKYTVASPRQPL